MTDLQISLIAIGIAIVVGVISYNKWQEYKTRKTVERAFSDDQHDVLMHGDTAQAQDRRVEPGFADLSDQSMPPETQTGPPFEEAIAPLVAEPTAMEETVLHAPRLDLPVDQLIDCTIALGLESPVRGERIVPVAHTLRHVGNKPVHFIGLASDGHWEAIAHGRTYTMLQAGIQLASRTSALNEIEYSEFVSRLRQVADELGAECDVPDMSRIVSIARGLYQFVAEYGAQLSVNVQSNRAPWQISTLLAALTRQGFDLRPDGRLVMPDGEGGTLFSIATNAVGGDETTSQLTLLLDVALVASSRDGYGAMISCARSLATRLDGTVVDDSGAPLTEDTLAEIATQVQVFYGDMENSEIPAGSTRALRLFA